MLFTVNVPAGTVVFSPKGTKSEGSKSDTVFEISSKEDVAALHTSEVIEVFNTVVRAHPELDIREVNRFSTRPVANERLWNLFVALRANAQIEAGEIDPSLPKKRAPKPSTLKPKSAATKSSVGSRKLKDKEIKPGAKQRDPKEGTMQAHAYNLVSQRGGISVDDYVKAMNAKKRAKYTRSNAWSSLCYILNRNHGFGLRCTDEVFTIWDGKH